MILVSKNFILQVSIPMLRAFDILFSLGGIATTFPLMVLIYIAGFFDTGAPLFFQQRIGKNQELFWLVKFRTMPINTKSVGTHLVSTTSITKLGHVLRKTKLDELPQLFNVLLGNMSLVGPRPCLSNQTQLISERAKRGVFNCKPGITGLAQVNNIDMSTPRKLAIYDKLMIDNMSIQLFLKLIISTALGKGRGDRVRVNNT